MGRFARRPVHAALGDGIFGRRGAFQPL